MASIGIHAVNSSDSVAADGTSSSSLKSSRGISQGNNGLFTNAFCQYQSDKIRVTRYFRRYARR